MSDPVSNREVTGQHRDCTKHLGKTKGAVTYIYSPLHGLKGSVQTEYYVSFIVGSLQWIPNITTLIVHSKVVAIMKLLLY